MVSKDSGVSTKTGPGAKKEPSAFRRTAFPGVRGRDPRPPPSDGPKPVEPLPQCGAPQWALNLDQVAHDQLWLAGTPGIEPVAARSRGIRFLQPGPR